MASFNTPQSSPENNGGNNLLNRRNFLRAAAVGTAGYVWHLMRSGHGTKDGHEKDHDHSAEVLAAWEKEQPLFDAINNAGGFQQYVDGLSDDQRNQIFQRAEHEPATKCACCVDEGIRSVMDANGNKEKLAKEAGSGILPLGLGVDLNGHDPFQQAYIRLVAQRHNDANIDEETYHEQCGAAAVAFKNLHGRDPSAEEAFDFTRRWTTAVFNARRDMLVRQGQGKRADKLSVRPIEFTQMQRPDGLHIPRVIYYGTPHDYESALLPQGYGVDRADLPKSVAQANAKISKAINFGAHGPGQLFTPENPQLVVCVGDRIIPAAQLKSEAEQAFSDDADYKAGRVRIYGFDEKQAA